MFPVFLLFNIQTFNNAMDTKLNKLKISNSILNKIQSVNISYIIYHGDVNLRLVKVSLHVDYTAVMQARWRGNVNCNLSGSKQLQNMMTILIQIIKREATPL